MDNGARSYRRFLDGDKSAFDAIMHESFDSLVFFINRYVRDSHAAEDIAIDAFSDLIVHPHRYNFRVTLKTYLFMLGRSRALNYIKHHARMVPTDFSEAEELPSPAKTPQDIALANEQRRIVSAALRSLPQEMASVIHLIYFEELSYAEAGKVMKKTPKQIDNLLYRAKKELRAVLGEKGEQLL